MTKRVGGEDDEIVPPAKIVDDSEDEDEEGEEEVLDKREVDGEEEKGAQVVDALPVWTPAQRALLERCIDMWTRYPDPLARLLSPANTEPPADGVASSTSTPNLDGSDAPKSPSQQQQQQPLLISTIIHVPKNPAIAKGGYLLVPTPDSSRWVKRFVELRRPYLHVHSAANGEEIAVVSLRNARVDPHPGILGLLTGMEEDPGGRGGGGGVQAGHRRTASGRVVSALWSDTHSATSSLSATSGSGGGGGGNGNNSNGYNGGGGDDGGSTFLDTASSSGQQLLRLSERLQAAVFAVYAPDNTWLFCARGERDKMDWIARVEAL
jgi:kinesin family protein 1